MNCCHGSTVDCFSNFRLTHMSRWLTSCVVSHDNQKGFQVDSDQLQLVFYFVAWWGYWQTGRRSRTPTKFHCQRVWTYHSVEIDNLNVDLKHNILSLSSRLTTQIQKDFFMIIGSSFLYSAGIGSFDWHHGPFGAEVNSIQRPHAGRCIHATATNVFWQWVRHTAKHHSLTQSCWTAYNVLELNQTTIALFRTKFYW